MLRTTSSESFENGVSVILKVGELVNLVVSQVNTIYGKKKWVFELKTIEFWDFIDGKKYIKIFHFAFKIIWGEDDESGGWVGAAFAKESGGGETVSSAYCFLKDHLVMGEFSERSLYYRGLIKLLFILLKGIK